jgi:hypothetical protein
MVGTIAVPNVFDTRVRASLVLSVPLVIVSIPVTSMALPSVALPETVLLSVKFISLFVAPGVAWSKKRLLDNAPVPAITSCDVELQLNDRAAVIPEMFPLMVNVFAPSASLPLVNVNILFVAMFTSALRVTPDALLMITLAPGAIPSPVNCDPEPLYSTVKPGLNVLLPLGTRIFPSAPLIWSAPLVCVDATLMVLVELTSREPEPPINELAGNCTMALPLTV